MGEFVPFRFSAKYLPTYYMAQCAYSSRRTDRSIVVLHFDLIRFSAFPCGSLLLAGMAIKLIFQTGMNLRRLAFRRRRRQQT